MFSFDAELFRGAGLDSGGEGECQECMSIQFCEVEQIMDTDTGDLADVVEDGTVCDACGSDDVCIVTAPWRG